MEEKRRKKNILEKKKELSNKTKHMMVIKERGLWGKTCLSVQPLELSQSHIIHLHLYVSRLSSIALLCTHSNQVFAGSPAEPLPYTAILTGTEDDLSSLHFSSFCPRLSLCVSLLFPAHAQRGGNHRRRETMLTFPYPT